jgi:hypothetical protein
MFRNTIILLIYRRHKLLDLIFIERYLSESIFANVGGCCATFPYCGVGVICNV